MAAPAWIRTRLSVMMFLEFFLWASWYVPLGGYATSTLKLTGSEISWLYATTAIAAIISPMFVGYVADRLFATERVLAALHLIGAICLLLAAWPEQVFPYLTRALGAVGLVDSQSASAFPPLMVLLVINALCFMPTLALVNSMAFRNIDDPNRFSRVAVWGTIGWIISGLTVGFYLGGTTERIFWLAGAGGIAMALYSLTLPHTPPKGAEAAGGDVLGLGALKLLLEPSFFVFALCAFLISIPLSFYFTWANAFLEETDRPSPTGLQTLSQFSEIFVMVVMPWFIARIGLKNVLVIGMGAWALRYLFFAGSSLVAVLGLPLIVLGLLMHGFCYCFVFIASFIYADKKAPPEISARAQSLVALLTWGVGMLIGTLLAGYTADRYPPLKIAAAKHAEAGPATTAPAPLPDWSTKEEPNRLPKALGASNEDSISVVAVERVSEDGLTIDGVIYGKGPLLDVLKKADSDQDGSVTKAEWRQAQAHQWPPIWLWPAGLAAAVCVLFWLGGRDVQAAETKG